MGLRFLGAARRGRSKKWQKAKQNNIQMGSIPALCVFCQCELLTQNHGWWKLRGNPEGFLSCTPNPVISVPINGRPPNRWVALQITGSKLFKLGWHVSDRLI